MLAPWNAVFPVEHMSLGILAIASGQNLCHRGISIPLGLAPRNFGSACLRSRNDHISVECLNLVHRGKVIPLGLAPWNVKHILSGSHHSLKGFT